MNAVDTLALTQITVLLASCLMTAGSVWTAGRLAPIVLGKAFQPASFREYFFKDDGDMSQSGYVMIMLSATVLLSMLLALTITARMLGWHVLA